MHIPDKYRDRYDRLAASHPWMREMRDADDVPEDELIRELRHYADDLRYEYNSFYDAFEPDERLSELCGEVANMLETRDETNGIDGETNGTHADAPLDDEPPEGDGLETLKDWISDVAIADPMLFDRADCKRLWEIADMVERDYVYRSIFDAVCAERDRLQADTDELSELCRQAQYKWQDMMQERDEWKAKAEQAERAMNKAAGKWARADTRSALRAAAVERLNSVKQATDENLLAAILGAPDGLNLYGAEKLVTLKALLTDDDANDDSAPDSDVSATDVDANDGNANLGSDLGSEPSTLEDFDGKGSKVDSREQLEADITHQFSMWFGNSPYPSQGHRTAVEWLDRQAAITRRECEHDREALDYYSDRYAEMDGRIVELTRKLEDAEFERDELESMIERDYVKRSTFDLACKKRDEAVRDAKLAVHARDSAMDERDALQEKLEDDWKYSNLKKQVDLLTVRAVGAEQEADELKAIVDRLTKERDELAADLKSCEGQLKTERNNFRQATGARDYWRDKLSMVLDRLRELGCEVGSINDVPITVELPGDGR